MCSLSYQVLKSVSVEVSVEVGVESGGVMPAARSLLLLARERRLLSRIAG